MNDSVSHPCKLESVKKVDPVELRKGEIDSLLQLYSTLDDEGYVRAIYQALLGRDPDSEGLKNATTLASKNRRGCIVSLLNSLECRKTTGHCSSVISYVKEIIATEQYQDAIDFLIESYAFHSKCFEVCYYLGLCNLKLQQFRTACRYFSEAHQIDSRNLDLLKSMIFVDLILNDENQALKVLGHLIAYHANNAAAPLIAAKLLKLADRIVESQQLMEKAVICDGYNNNLQNEIDKWEADLLACYKKYTDSQALGKRIANGLAAFENETGQSLIVLYQEFEGIDRQLVESQKILAQSPDNIDALILSAFCSFLKGLFKESEKLYRHALRIDCANKDAYVGFVAVLENIQKPDELKYYSEFAVNKWGFVQYFQDKIELANTRLGLGKNHRLIHGQNVNIVTFDELQRVSGLR